MFETLHLSPARLWRAAALSFALLSATAIVSCSSSGSGNLPPANTPVAIQGSSGRLLYTRDAALSTMDLGTAKTTQIVNPPELGQVHSARFSPDGTKIAYTMYEVRDRRVPVSEIYTATTTGSGASKILKADQAATFFQAPVWGASGKIYYMHVATNPQERLREIGSIDLATGKVATVVSEVGAFDVSPDEKWLALVRSESNGISLALFNLATGESREAVPHGRFEVISAPRFDPTSTKIVFSATPPTGAWTPPDPDRIGDRLLAFLSPRVALAHGLPQDLWTVPIEGGPATSLAKITADEPVAAWSPDGTRMAILSSEALVSLQLADGARKPILAPGGYGTVDWAP